MVRICILGFGKMGKSVLEEAAARQDAKVTAIVDAETNSIADAQNKVSGAKVISPEQFQSALEDFDALIDFSSASSQTLLLQAARAGKKIVVGTTARTKEQDDELAAEISKAGSASAVIAPNFSLGVNLMRALCIQAGRVLEGYDVEMVEAHHRYKKDAPSGTARMLAQAVSLDPAKIHCMRAGEIFGEHEMVFAANNEVLRISHSALSRRCFAKGAVDSALWLEGRNDGIVHDFSEVLGLA